MATQTGSLIRDQNLNVHFNVAPLGAKTNVTKAQKNGGLGGRKALNDISNSRLSSTLQKSKKLNSKNVIPVGEDAELLSSFGGKAKVSKATEKLQAGGRKALNDLTNSGKPHVHKALKKSQDNKKLIFVAEEQILPDNVLEEQFLHNHQECIKEQEKAIDMDYFLKTVGLGNDYSMQLASPNASPLSRKSKVSQWFSEVEEMPELLHDGQRQLPGSPKSPCGSPQSLMLWSDHQFTSFVLIESPKLSKN